MATSRNSATYNYDVHLADGTRAVLLVNSWWIPTIGFQLFELAKPGRLKRAVAVPSGDDHMVIAMAAALGVRINLLARTRYLNYLLPDDSAAFAVELPAHFLSTEVDDVFCGRNLSLSGEQL